MLRAKLKGSIIVKILHDLAKQRYEPLCEVSSERLINTLSLNVPL